ncbi:MAG: hypothetical protein ACRC7V_07340 [Lachnospiraceae bacterium]
MMLRIALCTPMNKADRMRNRIVSAVAEDIPIIDIWGDKASLHALQGALFYDAFWVAIDGAVGMELVITIKDYAPAIPVVWMSEDKLFSVIACNLNVVKFLTKDCKEEEIAAALDAIKNNRGNQYEHCVVLS